VGASVGDTAIYFALNGAKHVYAFEPDKKACRLAVRNIKSNRLQDKITVINEPCGTKGNSLSSIIQRYKIANPVLKIDCEGCEYGFILGANTEGLKKCNQIILEYHYGYLDIETRLDELGFKVTHTIPHISNYGQLEGRQSALGLIYAKQI
jgi:predicted RNA methylase